MKNSIAIYGSHDSNIAVRVGADDYRSYELERITGIRNYSLYTDPGRRDVLLKMKVFLKDQHGIEEYDSIFFSECEGGDLFNDIVDIFDPAHMEKMQHHFGHAACALWQSDFQEALIISFDSGGRDSEGVTYFNVFIGNKKDNSFTKLASLPLDICGAYTSLAYPLAVIKKTGYDSYLSWAGKMMGLVAYANPRENWISAFEKFYYGEINKYTRDRLFDSIGYNSGMNSEESFYGSAMVAATSQKVFEDLFFRAVEPFIQKYNLPVCVTGGGALNVILNQSLHDRLKADKREMFVPCNPNDSGLALGFMLLRYPPDSGKMKEVMYNGFPMLDKIDWGFVEDNLKFQDFSLAELARYLVSGKVIGFIQGDSEVGPRALGNRSILCYPDKKNIKDRVNKEIKFREDFRPFAPLIKEYDVDTFFPGEPKSKYMSYSQRASSLFAYRFPAVVHDDNTARLQTVTFQSNRVIFDLLTEVFSVTGKTPALMNTSFNSKGKPILTTFKEAFDVLLNTGLDAVYYNGILFEKR